MAKVAAVVMAAAVPAQEDLPLAPQIPRITRYQSPPEPGESAVMAVLVALAGMAASSYISAAAVLWNAGLW